MLWDCRIAVPLSYPHDKLHPESQSSAVASKLDLLRTQVPRPLMPHVKLLRGEGFCDAARLQDRDI